MQVPNTMPRTPAWAWLSWGSPMMEVYDRLVSLEAVRQYKLSQRQRVRLDQS